MILFGANITTQSRAPRALTRQAPRGGRGGGQPPLLIAVDQEGGSVKRIPWAPPTISPPADGPTRLDVRRARPGREHRARPARLGINVDLAPVADVPASTSSFMYQAGRTWSFNGVDDGALADAFAAGLESGGVVPAMKHFPGLGYATRNTDTYVETITASQAALAPGLLAVPSGDRGHRSR